MRKTKIVCTIGPACDSEETLRAMMLAGMNVARLNFSHGTHAEHQVRIDRIKKLRAELDLPIAIMLDTKGPEYRIGTFADGKIELHSGDTFTFTTEPVTGNAERVSVSYAGLAQDLEPGNTVLVNDGLIALTVTATTDTDVICRVTAGGVLSDRKSMSFPNKVLKQTFLSEQDKSDLLFGIENDVDFVAASFVSRKQDLADLNAFLRANGGEDISVIAKIENQLHHRAHRAADLALPRPDGHHRPDHERARLPQARPLMGHHARYERGVREHRRAVLPRAAGQSAGDAARKGRQGHHHRRHHQRPQRQHEHHQGRVRIRLPGCAAGTQRTPAHGRAKAGRTAAARRTEGAALARRSRARRKATRKYTRLPSPARESSRGAGYYAICLHNDIYINDE